MKIQPDIIGAQSINGYGADWIGVGGEKITSSVVIGSRGERFAWNCQRFEDLDATHFCLLYTSDAADE